MVLFRSLRVLGGSHDHLDNVKALLADVQPGDLEVVLARRQLDVTPIDCVAVAEDVQFGPRPHRAGNTDLGREALVDPNRRRQGQIRGGHFRRQGLVQHDRVHGCVGVRGGVPGPLPPSLVEVAVGEDVNVAVLVCRAAVEGQPHGPLDVGLVAGHLVAETLNLHDSGLDLPALIGVLGRVGGNQKGAPLVEFRQRGAVADLFAQLGQPAIPSFLGPHQQVRLATESYHTDMVIASALTGLAGEPVDVIEGGVQVLGGDALGDVQHEYEMLPVGVA